MINLIQNSILKNTSFISNLQGTLVSDHFEKLRFYTEDDVKLFGRLLELSVLRFFDKKSHLEKEYAEKSTLVNEELIKTLQQLDAYLGDSELYINADYVKKQSRKSPPKFILTEEQKALTDEDLEKCIKLSFQQEIANFMLGRAEYFKNMSSDDCIKAINQSTRYHHQAEQNKAARAQVTPPQPNEKRSTAYPMGLINRIGGEERFQQLLSVLANDRAFYQEVKEEAGALHCIVKDEDGIQWKIIAKFDDNFQLNLTNLSTLSAVNFKGERLQATPGKISTSIMLTAGIIPTGAYQYSIATIQEILTSRFKQFTTMGFTQYQMTLNELPAAVAVQIMNRLISDCPTRQQIVPIIRDISQSARIVQVMIMSAQLGVELSIMGGELEASDDLPSVVNDEPNTPAGNDEPSAPITPQLQLRRTRTTSGMPNSAAEPNANADSCAKRKRR